MYTLRAHTQRNVCVCVCVKADPWAMCTNTQQTPIFMHCAHAQANARCVSITAPRDAAHVPTSSPCVQPTYKQQTDTEAADDTCFGPLYTVAERHTTTTAIVPTASPSLSVANRLNGFGLGRVHGGPAPPPRVCPHTVTALPLHAPVPAPRQTHVGTDRLDTARPFVLFYGAMNRFCVRTMHGRPAEVLSVRF